MPNCAFKVDLKNKQQIKPSIKQFKIKVLNSHLMSKGYFEI